MAPTTRSKKRLNISVSGTKDKVIPPKRRRLTSQCRVPLSELVQQPELWFSDANLVLAAGHMCFKVHRSQLARFCTVFEDMLGLPSGGPDEELMEDVVVVRMPDDPQDLANFLNAIYNGCSFNFNTDRASNFLAISGVMRLATKYDCDVLRKRILGTIHERYPASWQALISRRFPPRWNDVAPYHTNFINLARECDFREVLVSCFYELAFKETNEPIGLLARADQRRLAKGKAAVLRRVRKILREGVPVLTHNECQSQSFPSTGRTRPKAKCMLAMEEFWTSLLCPSKLNTDFMKDPLRALSGFWFPSNNLTIEKDKEYPCKGCQYLLSKYMKQVSVDVGTNLQRDFNL